MYPIYQVLYKCSTCSEEKQVDGITLAQIRKIFDDLGWGNVPVQNGDKTDYIAYCPPCYARKVWEENQGQKQRDLDWEDEMHRVHLNEPDSLDAERPGLFH